MSLSARDFPNFFRAMHGYDPFPWQRMLVEHVLRDATWPEGIDLPTAAGKTACLDVAVFTLAADLDGDNRPALPRRIFFVVDRRIVVDAAHDRACRIAEKLRSATDGVVAEVARRLRGIADDNAAGRADPLHVSRQRGGIARDDAWVRDPTQPTIVTGTVDQVGSRMLFRGYGPRQLSQSIHAAMVASDSLILLDEAHCARPFMQTARRVRTYTGDNWARQPVTRPLQFVVLSATLPEEIDIDRRFPQDRPAALDHPLLRQRTEVAKPATLVVATKTPPKPRRGRRGLGELVPAAQGDKLVQHAANLAVEFAIHKEHRRVAVMVNRVATATAIYEQLHAEQERGDAPLAADVVLLTGRMRPVDRDEVVNRWERHLRAGAADTPPRPIIVVTTQCLEVGADWDFDALVTECAAIDALQQRFGRLNRLGSFEHTSAAILHRKKAPIKKTDDDPIYGRALDETWNWLATRADDNQCVDFGIAAMHAAFEQDPAKQHDLAAPSADAPVLLPAHLDLLCQTSPQPRPSPDVSIYLHGPQRGVPEARLVLRCDLADGDPREPNIGEQWLTTVGLLPPVAGEMLPIPLHRLRAWLADRDLAKTATSDGDVESQRGDDEHDQPPVGTLAFLCWRGRQDSTISPNPRDVRPNEIVVVRAATDTDRKALRHLGPYFAAPPDGPQSWDVTERARVAGGRRVVLRVTADVLGPLGNLTSVRELLSWATSDPEERDPSGWVEHIQAIAGETDKRLPAWLGNIAKTLTAHAENVIVESHPAAPATGADGSDGVILYGPRAANERTEADFPDGDDTASEADCPLTIEHHVGDVAQCAGRFTGRALDNPDLHTALALAARLHDAGKADERFQDLLHFNARTESQMENQLLAKSRRVPRTHRTRRRIRQIVGLPERFRHEMLSMQLAEACGRLPNDPILRDLVLHLIASHHGHARPFAPVCEDDQPPDVSVDLNGLSLSISGNQRREHPAHRIDSGVAERFWRLTRHFGWWGLAYLEALLRLADWRASEHPSPSAPMRHNRSEVLTP